MTAEALRDRSRQAVALQSFELFEALFGPRALVDLKYKSLWTMIWPDGLLGVPPAMLVPESPLGAARPSWLVERVYTRALPHLPGPPRAPPERPLWVALDGPTVDLGASRAALWRRGPRSPSSPAGARATR